MPIEKSAEIDKTEPKPAEKTTEQRNAEIVTEYETLLTQSQDEISIIKALCSKYSIEKEDLTELISKSQEKQGKPPRPGAGPANPAKEGQMGEAPPKGTVQSGKEPTKG